MTIIFKVKQDDIIAKLRQYMTVVGKDPDLIPTKGCCNGLSSLWLYYKWQQILSPEMAEQLMNMTTRIYDWDNTVESLDIQNTTTKITLREEFEKFIKMLQFAQEPFKYYALSQMAGDEILQNIQNIMLDQEISVTSKLAKQAERDKQEVTEEYSIAAIFTCNHSAYF